MSAANYAAACKQRAFESLSNRGTVQFHRSFSMDNITRAESCRVNVEVPIAELLCVQNQIVSSVFCTINRYGTIVALGAWDMGFDDAVPPTMITSRHWRKEAIPLPNEVLKIRGKAAVEFGVPQLQYVVTVERANVNTLVAIGFLSLRLTTPSLPATIAAPTAPQDASTPEDE